MAPRAARIGQPAGDGVSLPVRGRGLKQKTMAPRLARSLPVR